MKKIKVLMLGWEFPPVLTGGLGTACYGLVKALSHYAEIQLILPQAEAGNTMGGVHIQGLNYYGPEGGTAIDIPEIPLEEYARVKRVPAGFHNPYPVGIGFAREARALTTPEAIRAKRPKIKVLREWLVFYQKLSESRIIPTLSFNSGISCLMISQTSFGSIPKYS